MSAAPPATAPAADELVLVQRAARGDRQAFTQLVQAHQGYLRKLLGRVCRGDQARADDLAQEAFVRAWRALPQFRGEARFRTWLTRLAYSALSAERPALPTADPDGPDLATPTPDFAPGADWRLDLDRALATLSDAQRHAVLLCYGADLSHAEAAQVLGWPLGTVKTQVLRAKARLREHLLAWEPSP
ncbi:RNA polymerase sigma factor [Roseateles sp. BYS87W]|uniref:RNA polymerase sigma factor n=1 Tax=Pelomonas baiyunensis TaxID=3299026 RepID=A0ABW7GVJ1_9BURK